MSTWFRAESPCTSRGDFGEFFLGARAEDSDPIFGHIELARTAFRPEKAVDLGCAVVVPAGIEPATFRV
jgi:hypothetical protein